MGTKTLAGQVGMIPLGWHMPLLLWLDVVEDDNQSVGHEGCVSGGCIPDVPQGN